MSDAVTSARRHATGLSRFRGRRELKRGSSSTSGLIEHCQEALRGRAEECVAVVCHWGVINALCGDGADNCTVVECRRRTERRR